MALQHKIQSVHFLHILFPIVDCWMLAQSIVPSWNKYKTRTKNNTGKNNNVKCERKSTLMPSTEHWALSTEQPLNLFFLFISFATTAISFPCNNFCISFLFLFAFSFRLHIFPIWNIHIRSFDEFTMWNFCIEWYKTWIESLRSEFSTKKERTNWNCYWRLSFNILVDPSVHTFIHILNGIRGKKYEKIQNMTITFCTQGGVVVIFPSKWNATKTPHKKSKSKNWTWSSAMESTLTTSCSEFVQMKSIRRI